MLRYKGPRFLVSSDRPSLYLQLIHNLLDVSWPGSNPRTDPIKWLYVKRVNHSTIRLFISLEKCFCTVFCNFFEIIFDCTCASADQSLYAGIVYKHYCLCPCWPCARKSFKKVGLVYVHDVPWMLGCEPGHVGPITNSMYPYPPRPPTIGPIVWSPQGIAITSIS
jgi:hypothetical protein